MNILMGDEEHSMTEITVDLVSVHRWNFVETAVIELIQYVAVEYPTSNTASQVWTSTLNLNTKCQ